MLGQGLVLASTMMECTVRVRPARLDPTLVGTNVALARSRQWTVMLMGSECAILVVLEKCVWVSNRVHWRARS